MIAPNRPRFNVSLEDLDGQLDLLRDQQPFGEEQCCSWCEAQAQLALAYVNQQRLRRTTGRLRWRFWGLVVAALVSYVAAWYCMPHPIGLMFMVFASVFTFLGGDVAGRLGLAREMEDGG